MILHRQCSRPLDVACRQGLHRCDAVRAQLDTHFPPAVHAVPDILARDLEQQPDEEFAKVRDQRVVRGVRQEAQEIPQSASDGGYIELPALILSPPRRPSSHGGWRCGGGGAELS